MSPPAPPPEPSQRQMRGITNVGQVRPGQDPRGRVEHIHNTDTFTLFTKIGGNHLVYSAEGWVRVVLRLETAGPVAVSTRQDVPPVLSGKGILLGVDDITLVLSKGQRLFYSAEAVNRVRFVVEPIPWGESLLFASRRGFDRVVDALSPLQRMIKR
jgi:hypothetical protein